MTFSAGRRAWRGATVLALAGDLDMAAIPSAEARPRQALEGPPPRLVVDVTALSFVDSRGIRLLLQSVTLARGRGVELSVTRPPLAVWRLLERFRLETRMPLTGSVPDSGGWVEPAVAGAAEVRLDLAGDAQAPGAARQAVGEATSGMPESAGRRRAPGQ